MFPDNRTTRERILDTAMQVFARSGFHHASLREIAAECGLTHPALIYHFKSKADLLAAVLSRRDQIDTARLGHEQITCENAFDLMVSVVEFNSTAPGLVQLFTTLSAEATAPGHPAHEWLNNRYRFMHDMAQKVLIDRGLDPQQVRDEATLVLAVMDGLQIQWLLDPDKVDMVALLRRYLDDLAERLDLPKAS